MRWLVIGGGSEAEATWRKYPTDKIITSNRGLKWCPNPDVYWITDPLAIERYRADWESYSGEIISNSPNIPHATRWPYLDRKKGKLYHGRSSGILACRVALERGASELIMVGFQGHHANDELKDAHDKKRGTYGSQAEKRNMAMALAFQDMANEYQHVKFVFVGETKIKLPTRFVRAQ